MGKVFMRRIFSIICIVTLFVGCMIKPLPVEAVTFGFPVNDTNVAISCGYLGYENHYGYDLAVGTGTELFALFSGTATFYQIYDTATMKSASYGNYVEIVSSDGVYKTRYCHLDRFNGVSLDNSIISCKNHPSSSEDVSCKTVPLGSRSVKEGELIGYSGTTGNSTGPHLHLELMINNSYVNPNNYITRSFTASSKSTINWQSITAFGFDYPTSYEEISDWKFLFQGWVEASKDISSITCSINDGAKYVTANLYTRENLPNATAFRVEIRTKYLNIGTNKIAVCVNYKDGTAEVADYRYVNRTRPAVVCGYDDPKDNEQIDTNTFLFQGWVDADKEVKTITASLNDGEKYFTANLYTRSDVSYATAFRLDINTSNLKYGDNTVSVCVTYADGTSETVARRTVKVLIADAIDYPTGTVTLENDSAKLLLQGWSHHDNKTIDYFEYSIGDSKYRLDYYIRENLMDNARAFRCEIPATKFPSTTNTLKIYVYYTDGTNRLIGTRTVKRIIHVHSLVKTEAKAATCTTDGNTEYYTCSSCSKVFSDSEGKNEIAVENTVITKTGHDYVEGVCSRCGQADPALPAVLAKGESGDVTWKVTEDGVLTFTGNGAMKNYTYKSEMPWYNYINSIHSVIIQDGVTAIGDYAFYGMPELTEITIPASVTRIGDYAFKNATALENVVLPSGLTKLGESAFYGCAALKEITIPEGIYTVWSYTFKNCSSLEKVKFPRTLIKIDQGAFENCTSLPYVYIQTEVEIIDSWSFKGCKALEEVDMSWADATEVREGAFKNCSALTKIAFPEGIEKFGDSAFYGIGATEFTVPATVTEVGPWCFARAYGLKEVVFEGDAPTIGEGAFNKITVTVYYPAGNATWTGDVMQNYGGTVTWKAK